MPISTSGNDSQSLSVKPFLELLVSLRRNLDFPRGTAILYLELSCLVLSSFNLELKTSDSCLEVVLLSRTFLLQLPLFFSKSAVWLPKCFGFLFQLIVSSPCFLGTKLCHDMFQVLLRISHFGYFVRESSWVFSEHFWSRSLFSSSWDMYNVLNLETASLSPNLSADSKKNSQQWIETVLRTSHQTPAVF